MMSRADYLALFLSILAVIAAYLVAELVFEQMPHIEDEMAYVWQAQVNAKGYLSLPSPPHPRSFLVPFVVDYGGQRFGKYPPGWPAMLAVGVFLGLRSFVNPVLAGLGVWLIYRLGKRYFGELVGLLAAALTLTSPFFLMNSGSLLSHPFGLVLSSAFALAWPDVWNISRIDLEENPKIIKTRTWLATLVAALSLGVLIITRPLTAVGVALPFIFHGLCLLVHSGRRVVKRLVVFILIVLILTSLYFLWQFAVTGDPWLNPYTLWWDYDKVGFGPGYGHTETGHNLHLAKINTRFSLWVGRHDLFGWGAYSWIFLPFGLLGVIWKRNWKALPMLSVFPSLVLVYIFYWIGSSLFGPRYYYEGLHSLTILSSVGIAFLAGLPIGIKEIYRSHVGWRKLRPLAITGLLALLLSANLLFYIPKRVGGMFALYGVTRSRLKPFQTAQAEELAPALVIVHPNKWTEYGSLLELEDPFLTSPLIFTMSRGAEEDAALAQDFPDRTVIHYYPKEPFVFYIQRK